MEAADTKLSVYTPHPHTCWLLSSSFTLTSRTLNLRFLHGRHTRVDLNLPISIHGVDPTSLTCSAHTHTCMHVRECGLWLGKP